MRVLKPEIAKERKDKILNWVVYNYIVTGKPVSSDVICKEGKFNLSSATIRNILKELEEEGYLNQVHISGGRIPTDKGYRAYVDYILAMQKLAEAEKSAIEIEYDKKMEQLDYFLKHTTKILSDLSKKTGFSVFSDIMNENLKRIDIVKISPRNFLFVIVTDSGVIKHQSFVSEKDIDKHFLRSFVLKFNKKYRDFKISEIPNAVLKDFKSNENEIYLANMIVSMLNTIAKEEESFYLEGISRIYEDVEETDIEEIRAIARLLEEKERIYSILREKLQDYANRRNKALLPTDADKKPVRFVDVSIGSENSIKEFRNFSLVSSSYCVKDKPVGLIGVIGYKRMEYPKVISIVENVSSIVEEILKEWEKFVEDEEF